MTRAFYISAAHKSSGKTTLTLAMSRALARKGFDIQNFKKGPDYIDVIWHGYASGRPGYNLDFNTQSRQEIIDLYNARASAADIAIVEGNKGLFDGLDVEGSDSNAALAKLLGLPVVLVLDVSGITRGAAPLLMGYQQFDPEINYAGVILNKVRLSRQEEKIRSVIERYTDFNVLGAMPVDHEMHIEERHLGLQPGNEMGEVNDLIDRFATRLEAHVDLAPLLEMPVQAYSTKQANDERSVQYAGLRIGIVRDKAFGFYYADDLDALTAYGVELIEINSFTDDKLPDLDALFIGGGFPEMYIRELQSNKSLRADIRKKLEGGLPCYAECGGLMYLSGAISFGETSGDMVGFLPCRIAMHDNPQGRGLVRLETREQHPWKHWPVGQSISAHEFHYSSPDNSFNAEYGFDVRRGQGIDGQHDAIVKKNTVASYCHLRQTHTCMWIEAFLKFVKDKK